MKKVIYLFLSLVFITYYSSSQDFKTLNNLSNQTIQEIKELGDFSQVGSDGLPQYFKGMVYVKVKSGIVPKTQLNSKTKGLNSIGINGLDVVSSKYGISKVEPTFNLAKDLAPRVKNRNLSITTNNNELSRIFTFYFNSKYSYKQVVKELVQLADVEYAEPVPLYYTLETPNDPSYSLQQHLPQMQCPQAWDIHKGQNGDGTVLIGICDSGVDWKHNDLVGNLFNNLGEDADHDGHTIEWNGSQWVLDPGDLNGVDDDGNGYIDDLSGWNFWTADGTTNNNIMGSSSNAHGTHVAGISAGVTNNSLGVASVSWNVKFIGTKHGDNRYGNAIYYGFDGIIYLAQNGADVVNCSWGGGGYSQTGQIAINYATSLGCIVVAAAGNNNSGSAFYPAAYDNVLSVASVAVNDKKAYYSNYGYTVDVSAPGGDAYVDGGILSTIPGNNYAKYQGTSMASPQVTGLIGYVKSYLPTISNDKLIRRILGNADPIDALNQSYIGKLGSGRINAYKSLLFESTNKLPLKLVTNGIYTQKVNDYYTVAFDVTNYSLDGAEKVKFEISTTNPNILIMSQYGYGPLTPNATTKTGYMVSFKILNPNSNWATINMHMTGVDNSILVGADYSFDVFCGDNATLVYEKYLNGPTTSGKFINDYLVNNGYPNIVYTNKAITNLVGFNYAFFSMGNADSYDYGTLDNIRSEAIKSFLKAGGKLYIESGDGLGYEQAGNYEFLNLFGIAEGYDGIASHTFAGLQGGAGTITEGMNFTATTQNPYGWIDYFTLNTGKNAFFEPGIGIVGVQNTGSYGQKTFAFSYALSKLTDGAVPSTKTIFMQRLLGFFGLYNQTVSAVQLNLPANASVLYSNVNFTLSWMNLSNTWDYQLQVSQFSDFRTLKFDGYLTDLQKVFSPSDFISNNTYYWRVRGRNNLGNGPWSEIRNFMLMDQPPAKTVLTYPSNTGTVNSLRPTLQWNPADRATSYILEIARNQYFTIGYQKFSYIGTNSFYLYTQLINNTVYYWRITSRNQAGLGPVSDVWTFKTYMCADKPVLTIPTNGAVNQETILTLSWNPVQYANSYELQISEFSDFSNSTVYSGIYGTSKQITNGLSTGKTYYWKVRSSNDCGFSNFSDIYSFTTKSLDFYINLENKTTCFGVSTELGTFSGGNLVTVTGGSGSFKYTWSPTYGMINETTGNPTILNPNLTQDYSLTVLDLVSNVSKTKSMTLNVLSSVNIQMPLFVFMTVGNSLNLDGQISGITGGVPPYTTHWYDSYNNLIMPPIIRPPLGTYMYKVTVSDAFNCNASKNIQVIVTSLKYGLNEYSVAGNSESGLMITYPNPVTNELHLNVYSTENKPIHYEIKDLIGRKILEDYLGSHQSFETVINLNQFLSGVYILNLYLGDEILAQKIIKQ